MAIVAKKEKDRCFQQPSPKLNIKKYFIVRIQP